MTLCAIGFAVLLVILFIYLELTDKPRTSMLSKGFASFGFILVFASALYEKIDMGNHLFIVTSHYLNTLTISLIFLLGLVCGLLGDLYLAIRPLEKKEADKCVINGGILYFSLGHIFYFIALLLLGKFSYLSLILGIVMTIVIYFGSQILKFEMGKAKIASLIYTFIIFMFVGQAVGFAGFKDYNTFSVMILVGAILFSISDLILAPIYFKESYPKWMIIINYITYYGAQLLIAASILYII